MAASATPNALPPHSRGHARIPVGVVTGGSGGATSSAAGSVKRPWSHLREQDLGEEEEIDQQGLQAKEGAEFPSRAGQGARDSPENRDAQRASNNAAAAHKVTRARSTGPPQESHPVRWEPEHNDLDLEAEEVEGGEQVILALLYQGASVAAAYYTSNTGQVCCIPDRVEDLTDLSFTAILKRHARPTTILVSTKTDEKIAAELEKIEGDEDAFSKINVITLPNVDFDHEAARTRLCSWPLPCFHEGMGAAGRHLKVSHLADSDSVNMIRCLGALLKYLAKHRVGVELEDPRQVPVPITAILISALDAVQVLDANTISALQIFFRESHPSTTNRGRTKEGLSLFGICSKTKSPGGSKMLRQWFMQPLRDLALLQQRQVLRLDAVAFFVDPRSAEIVVELTAALRKIKGIERVLRRMRISRATLADWKAMQDTCVHAFQLGDMCARLADRCPIAIFGKIAEAFTSELRHLAEAVANTINMDESLGCGRLVVRHGVDAELDERKAVYAKLPAIMTSVAQEEIATLPPGIEECSVVYLPQIGYLLAIPRPNESMHADECHIDGLEFMFFSEKTAHYKSSRMRELDATLGDAQCDIVDRETAIAILLQNRFLEQAAMLLQVSRLTAELDCLLCLATCAREFNYVRPQLTTEKVLTIVGGRHPLQELCTSPFVPNDTYFGERAGHISILTGPNGSGKSVYIKQVGLIVFLAHIGSFVPAEEATIGLVDRIFTRIQTRESVSANLSAFLIDVNQVATAVHASSHRSLILLDEFGKGTSTSDGIGLLVATVDQFLARQHDCPFVLVTTHFHDIFRHSLLQPTPLLRFERMDALLDEGSDAICLFQLRSGTTASSHARHIALAAGIPRSVVERGEEVSELIKRGLPLGRSSAPGADLVARRSTEVCQQFLAADIEGCADIRALLAVLVNDVMDLL